MCASWFEPRPKARFPAGSMGEVSTFPKGLPRPSRPFPMRFLLAVGALVALDLLLALFLPAREATAGTALRLDVAELVHASELVLEGRVLAAAPREVEGLLTTEYLLEVERTHKGEHQATRALRIPGGLRADGSGLLIPGLPTLHAGEEVLLFLGPESRAGARLPTGLAQGKFSVERLADGSKRLLRDSRALELFDGEGFERGARARVAYAELLAAITAASAAERSGR